MKVNCLVCKKEFRTYPCRIKTGEAKYCSRKCSNGITLFKKGQHYWLDKKRPNLINGNASKTMFKKGLIPWNKGIIWKEMQGENNPAWVGGHIKHPDKRIRKSPEYILWRIAVFMRDNYTCVGCGFKGYLQADHIKPFKLYPELRFAIDNGQTLCLSCHKKKTAIDMIFIRKGVVYHD
jgi:hypothetical protein